MSTVRKTRLDMAPLKLLLIEDESDLTEILVDFLKPVTTSIITCATGREALELMRSQSFDVIVTDICLPDIPGTQVLENARRIPHLAGTRLVTISGSPLAYSSIAKLAHATVSKPFRKSTLLQAIGVTDSNSL